MIVCWGIAKRKNEVREKDYYGAGAMDKFDAYCKIMHFIKRDS